MFIFFKFYRSLFLRVWLTISQYWFRYQWYVAEGPKIIEWSSDILVRRRMYASPLLNALQWRHKGLRWLVNSPHKRPVTRKMFLSDDIIMESKKMTFITICIILLRIIIFTKPLILQVVYFTALFPYIIIFIMLGRGLTLEGNQLGVDYFTKPKWHLLKEPKVTVIYRMLRLTDYCLVFSQYDIFSENTWSWQAIASPHRRDMVVSLGPRSSKASVSIVQSFWRFAQNTPLILLSSEQNSKTIGWQSNKSYGQRDFISYEFEMLCVYRLCTHPSTHP